MKIEVAAVLGLILILLLTIWLLSHAFIIVRLLPILVFLAFTASVLVLIWVVVKVRRKL